MTKEPSTCPHVYKAISAITKALAAHGVAKRTSPGLTYAYRGVDDIHNALAPLLPEHGLVILPSVVERSSSERTTRNGTAMVVASVGVDFEFVSSVDGSKHTIRAYGDGEDTGDKAVGKALSSAYKSAAILVFSIPTGADEGHGQQGRQPQRQARRERPPERPVEFVGQLTQAKLATTTKGKTYALLHVSVGDGISRRVVCWDDDPAQYLEIERNAHVRVTGAEYTRRWEQDGAERSMQEVRAERIERVNGETETAATA